MSGPLVRPLPPVAAKERPVPNTGTASEVEAEKTTADVLIELHLRRAVPGSAILDSPATVESVWGDGHRCLWAAGEPFLMCGPDGVGKTSLMQQVTLRLAGIGEPALLGLPISGRERVLYLACDRPAQAMRSFSRMVTQTERTALAERLVIWKGPLPFDVAAEPMGLLALARRFGCDVVVVDSVKDVAGDLSREETGQGLNRALQACVAEGVDVAGLHHQRKAQAGAGKPNRLADVYGSRWLTAGAGSVVMLWGDPGDPVVEFAHLKQPDEPVGPFQIVHDHLSGVSTVVDHLDAFTVVGRSPGGATAADVAQALYGESSRNATVKAKRQLDRLFNEGKIQRQGGVRGGSAGGAKGSSADRYYRLDGRFEGLRDA